MKLTDKIDKYLDEATTKYDSGIQARDIEYLLDLHASGFDMNNTKKVITSMRREYGLTDSEAHKIFEYWKKNYKITKKEK